MTSEIFKIFRPHTFKALTADSLPDPGPETSTSTSERPKFIAFSPALVAAIWAAKGVLFLEPLNPFAPELYQEIVFPFLSVILIIVLLKVARI